MKLNYEDGYLDLHIGDCELDLEAGEINISILILLGEKAKI
ncbi:MAG: hypothetical protein RR642_12845 [Solibacillus sp.]